MGVTIHVGRVRPAPDLPLPRYLTPGSAGADLCADLAAPLILLPGARALIPTGLVLYLPPGFEGQIRPRSGLALRHGITCLNTPGTVDSDYRGEVGVVLINLSQEPFTLHRGDRIAQLVVAPVVQAAFVEGEPESDPGTSGRGGGGFGSTGR